MEPSTSAIRSSLRRTPNASHNRGSDVSAPGRSRSPIDDQGLRRRRRSSFNAKREATTVSHPPMSSERRPSHDFQARRKVS